MTIRRSRRSSRCGRTRSTGRQHAGADLEAHGEAAGDVRVSTLRRRVRRSGRIPPWSHSLGSALAGSSWTAIHMSWGAINEWTTQAGYARLATLSGHPMLAEVLGRIMRQEGRHINFYASQAEERLGSDRRAQRLTRFALQRFWNPVGSDVMPETEVQCLIDHLFGGVDGRHAGRTHRSSHRPASRSHRAGAHRDRPPPDVTPGSRDQHSVSAESSPEQVVERPSRCRRVGTRWRWSDGGAPRRPCPSARSLAPGSVRAAASSIGARRPRPRNVRR